MTTTPARSGGLPAGSRHGSARFRSGAITLSGDDVWASWPLLVTDLRKLGSGGTRISQNPRARRHDGNTDTTYRYAAPSGLTRQRSPEAVHASGPGSHRRRPRARTISSSRSGVQPSQAKRRTGSTTTALPPSLALTPRWPHSPSYAARNGICAPSMHPASQLNNHTESVRYEWRGYRDRSLGPLSG